MAQEEEYEVIPTSPLKRLEKRMNKLEDTSSTSETRRLIEQIIELIKSNQRVIDDIVKSDAELRNEVSKLPGKIDELLSNMAEFVEMLKAAAGEEATGNTAAITKESLAPLVTKMDDFIKTTKKSQEISQATLASLGVIDKRLKRMYLQTPSTTRSRRY